MVHLARLILATLLVALAVTVPAGAAGVHGTVSHVTDGDTLWVRAPGAADATQVRIQGIDAPEICQAFGLEARAALAAHILHRQVQVSVKARDMYQRAVGRVSAQGQDVGAWLVAGGYAWSSRYRGRAGPYAAQEQQARVARRGLWAGQEPLEPRAFRKRHGSCREGAMSGR